MTRVMRPAVAVDRPSSPALQQPPPGSAFTHLPVSPALPSHVKFIGQLSLTPTMQSCVQYLSLSVVVRQSLLLQYCGYVHASPTSPAGGSQKHLPASHFCPARQVDALAHGAPLVTVTGPASASSSRSSNDFTTMSITPSGTIVGIVSGYCVSGWPFAPHAAPLPVTHL